MSIERDERNEDGRRLSRLEEGTGTGTGTGTAQSPNDDSREIAKRESKIIPILRVALLLILITATIAVTTFTYYIMRREQQERYTVRFQDYGEMLVTSFYRSTTKKCWVAVMMSSVLTSYAERSGEVYPNVTQPDFPILAIGARHLANASAITFSPILFTRRQLASWEAFAAEQVIAESNVLDAIHLGEQTFQYNRTTKDGIYSFGQDGQPVNQEGSGPFVPIWHISPYHNNSATRMYDQMAEEARRSALQSLTDNSGLIFSRIIYDEVEKHPVHVRGAETPRGIIYMPVASSFSNRSLVGVIGVEFEWEHYFDMTFPLHFRGLIIVLESMDGHTCTFRIENDGAVKHIGRGDLHDRALDHQLVQSAFEGMDELFLQGFEDLQQPYIDARRKMQQFVPPPAISLGPSDIDFNVVSNHPQQYRIKVYPSQDFKQEYISKEPIYYALGVAALCVLTFVIVFAYDRLMERRQNMTMESAARSRSVINALYPANVRVRFLQNGDGSPPANRETRVISTTSDQRVNKNRARRRRGLRQLPMPRWSSAETRKNIEIECNAEMQLSAPIADLFPNTTVLFADIVGFTAWSSEREPAQVFQLLETIFRNFDRLAKTHGVFKVETIGDCYVAVTGLPEPNDDHAQMMCHFASDINSTMREVCRKLESLLGPGTADLSLRIGMHSGAVTAGVLRGEKGRFQLFGDTMNTASRMESNSKSNRIHLSHTTADLLIHAGKAHWLTARATKIEVKGKGTLQTYWLHSTKGLTPSAKELDNLVLCENGRCLVPRNQYPSVKRTDCSFVQSNRSSSIDTTKSQLSISESMIDCCPNDKMGRLVDWSVEVLGSSLQKLVALRQCKPPRIQRRNSCCAVVGMHGCNPVEELTDIIQLPDFEENSNLHLFEHVQLDTVIRDELKHFVGRIASMYRNNPFHNLEHASHVTMSANKLMNRVVALKSVNMKRADVKRRTEIERARNRHKATFGISSDPLAQFAIVFSALIHDVDHSGLTNAQLVNDGASVASLYGGLSVAEQNSVTVAWSILDEPAYERLRYVIFPTTADRKRFRQLVVTMVLATDIVDTELQQLRKNRWKKAFHEIALPIASEEDRNRKATIVIEHIIQASDVAHTMQHWHVYRNWNEKLFEEVYLAYLAGHVEEEPSLRWFENELCFFDRYVIPLAKKLKECGVFGVSSDEYLDFALKNRAEWEMKGREVVGVMAIRAHKKGRSSRLNQPPQGQICDDFFESSSESVGKGLDPGSDV